MLFFCYCRAEKAKTKTPKERSARSRRAKVGIRQLRHFWTDVLIYTGTSPNLLIEDLRARTKMSKIATFGKFNRNKIARLKSSVHEPNHETCLVLDRYAHHKTPTNIATRQHIWLLTSKLIKKTANMTTHRAVIYQICQHSIFCQLQKHGTFHLSKNRCETCLALIFNVKFPYFVVYEYNIFTTCASWCREFTGDKNDKSTHSMSTCLVLAHCNRRTIISFMMMMMRSSIAPHPAMVKIPLKFPDPDRDPDQHRKRTVYC